MYDSGRHAALEHNAMFYERMEHNGMFYERMEHNGMFWNTTVFFMKEFSVGEYIPGLTITAHIWSKDPNQEVDVRKW